MVDLINKIKEMNEIKSDNADRKISVERIFYQGYNEACCEIIEMLSKESTLDTSRVREKELNEDVF